VDIRWYVIASLLNIFKTSTNLIIILENHTYDYSTYVYIFIYINDGKLIISFFFLDINNSILTKAYQLVGQWLHLAKFSFDKDKRKLIYYTQRKKNKKFSYIDLTNCDSSIYKIIVGPTVYWLEVYFNYKLLSNHMSPK